MWVSRKKIIRAALSQDIVERKIATRTKQISRCSLGDRCWYKPDCVGLSEQMFTSLSWDHSALCGNLRRTCTKGSRVWLSPPITLQSSSSFVVTERSDVDKVSCHKSMSYRNTVCEKEDVETFLLLTTFNFMLISWSSITGVKAKC